jgi:DNA-binding MarR family transcriptional regulator
MTTQSPAGSQADNAAQVLRRFRIVFNAVRTHFRQIESAAGLGGAQVWALSLIKSNPKIGVNEIAASMDIHQSTASNLMKVLLKKEMITMTKSAGDKRVVELRITPEGRKVLKKIQGPFEGVLPAALARLDEAVLARLNADLQLLARELQADDDAGGIPLAEL